MPRPRASRTRRERRSAARASCTSPASTRSGAAVWPARSSPARSSSQPDRYVAGIADSKVLTAADRERLFDDIIARRGRLVGGDRRRAGRDRPHQHSPASLQAMRAGRDGARAAAGLRARRRLPDSRPGHAAAADHRRRPPVDGHRGGVDSGQGHARPPDARRCTRAIRATGSTATRATRRASISTPSARFGYSPVHRRTFRPPSLFDTIAPTDAFGRRLEHPHSRSSPASARRGVPRSKPGCC